MVRERLEINSVEADHGGSFVRGTGYGLRSCERSWNKTYATEGFVLAGGEHGLPGRGGVVLAFG